jgi:hypothetical protein
MLESVIGIGNQKLLVIMIKVEKWAIKIFSCLTRAMAPLAAYLAHHHLSSSILVF